jgi:hypothetical protein
LPEPLQRKHATPERFDTKITKNKPIRRIYPFSLSHQKNSPAKIGWAEFATVL